MAYFNVSDSSQLMSALPSCVTDQFTCELLGPAGFVRASTFKVWAGNIAAADSNTNTLFRITIYDPTLCKVPTMGGGGSCRELFGAGGAGENLRAVGELDVVGIHQVGTILREKAADDYVIPRLHGTPVPALALENIRTAHFEFPIHEFAVAVERIYIEARMRVHPLNFGDYSFESDRLIGGEFGGERVMCEDGSGASDATNTYDQHCE